MRYLHAVIVIAAIIALAVYAQAAKTPLSEGDSIKFGTSELKVKVISKGKVVFEIDGMRTKALKERESDRINGFVIHVANIYEQEGGADMVEFYFGKI